MINSYLQPVALARARVCVCGRERAAEMIVGLVLLCDLLNLDLILILNRPRKNAYINILNF